MGLGQIFTKNKILQKKIFDLCKNKKKCLEPSSGAGHLVNFFYKNGITKITSIEIDSQIKIISKIKPIFMNFFDYSTRNKFDTIFGNPPYVRHQEIENNISKSVLSNNCNLYLYFVEKCFYHLKSNGEIVLIIPRDMFNNTRGMNLRKLLYQNGTITDIIDYEEKSVFNDASPYPIIIRYEKNNCSHLTNYVLNGITEERKEILKNENLLYLKDDIKKKKLGDFFNVCVGIVSGANSIFEKDSPISIEIICSDFIRTGKKRKFIFTEPYNLNEIKNIDIFLYHYLINNKKKLINRKIKKFNESNWFKWGAIRNIEKMKQKSFCIYVNAKTREKKPFFKEKIDYFDGSVLGIFPKKKIDLDKWVKILNSSETDFREQNLLVNNKYILTQRNLENFLF